MKKLGILVVFLAVIGLGSFIGFSIKSKTSSSAFKVGVLAPLTGEGATYGASMRRGIELALKGQSNIEVIFEDTVLSPQKGVAAANKLISLDNVRLIYGAASSGVSKAILPIANKKGILLFSSISTSDSLSIKDDYFFRNVPSNNIQGNTAADYLIKKHKIKKVAIFNENDEYGTNLASSFRDKIKNEGVEVVFDDAYSAETSKFETSLLKIKASGAEAVFIPGNYEESAQIIKQAKEVGITIPFVGGDGSYSPNLIENAKASAEGFICTVMSVDKSTPFYKEFYDKFKEMYQREPDVYDSYAYEAGVIILQAIKSANNDIDIKSILSSNKYNGFSDNMSFNEYGEIARPYGIVMVSNSKFVDIED